MNFIPVDGSKHNDAWDQHDTLMFSFTGELTKDIGPFKKGQIGIWIFDFENGKLEGFDVETGQVQLGECEIKLDGTFNR